MSRFHEGEWAWVSGASSGIGAAIALRLASEGVNVALSARRTKELEATAEAIREQGAQALVLALDASDPRELSAAAKRIETEAGRLDMVVPAAGKELLAPLDVVRPSQWEDLLRLQVTGAFEMVRCSLRSLRRAGASEGGQGRVLFVSSAAAKRGWPGQSAYAAAKGAQLAGMRSLAAETALAGIRVNALLPGIVRTAMQERMFSRMPEANRAAVEASHPLGLGSVEDVAGAAAYLLSHEARWITGAELLLDGGLSLG